MVSRKQKGGGVIADLTSQVKATPVLSWNRGKASAEAEERATVHLEDVERVTKIHGMVVRA